MSALGIAYSFFILGALCFQIGTVILWVSGP